MGLLRKFKERFPEPDIKVFRLGSSRGRICIHAVRATPFHLCSSIKSGAQLQSWVGPLN